MPGNCETMSQEIQIKYWSGRKYSGVGKNSLTKHAVWGGLTRFWEGYINIINQIVIYIHRVRKTWGNEEPGS